MCLKNTECITTPGLTKTSTFFTMMGALSNLYNRKMDCTYIILRKQQQLSVGISYSNRRVKLVRSIQERLCLPSNVNLGNTIDSGCLLECQISKRGVCIATIIYGRSKFAIEGKSTHCKHKTFEEGFSNEIPKYIINEYSKVTLFMDIMYVNGLAFMVLTANTLD